MSLTPVWAGGPQAMSPILAPDQVPEATLPALHGLTRVGLAEYESRPVVEGWLGLGLMQFEVHVGE